MMKTNRPFTRVLLGLALLGLPAECALALDFPATPMHVVTNTYHGTAVVDNYQWLENFDDPAVQAWNKAENKITRDYLDALSPRTAIAAQLKKLYSATSASYSGLDARPGALFAMKFQPPKQQPWLIRLKSPEDAASAQVVLDPNQLDPTGATTIDWAVPSLDGKMVAVSLSKNGSEDGTLYFYDAATGQPRPDKIPRVQYPTASGSAVWNADGTGVYYTRYPHPGEKPAEDQNFYQQVYFHKLGTPVEQDQWALGKDLPRIAEIALSSTKDGRFRLATVANGDGGEFDHYLQGADGAWRQLDHFNDKIVGAWFGDDEALYLLSRLGAPRGKILRLPLTNPELAQAKVVVPESEAVIGGVCQSAKGLFVGDLVGGPSQIRFFKPDGTYTGLVPLMAVSAVPGMLCLEDGRLLFDNLSYIHPFVWSVFDSATGQARPTALAGSSPADFGDAEVVRDFATSKDGTRVPLNIIRRKGTKLDGSNPTLLYGYGGYGISMSPNFNLSRRVWLDQGGVYVVANIRGGGEFGESWHLAGNLTKKQNVFDDFAAAAQYLIKAGYTRTEKLAVEGGSNGGLLMGAFLTQHPDLVRAVVSHVGIYDSLRSELEPNGAFNVTEFGTVKDPAQFQALYAYSPYHRVVDGTHYPAILMLTGDHDGRVNPFHSRKMIARLQAANKSAYPILLRTTSSAGHGIGTALDERIAEQADVFAFLFDQLGVRYTPAAK